MCLSVKEYERNDDDAWFSVPDVPCADRKGTSGEYATLCRRCVTPGMKAVRRTADVPTLLKKVSGPDFVMLFVNS